MATIYLLTNSPDQLQGAFFKSTDVSTGGRSNVVFWNEFNEALRQSGHALATHDQWSKEIANPDDILIVVNHPGETLLWKLYYLFKHFKSRGGFILDRQRFLNTNYRFFQKRILLQAEPPMVMPYVYRNLSSLDAQRVYTKILLVCKGFGAQYGYFNNFSDIGKDITSRYFNNQTRKFLTLINANVTPHSFINEFYGERLKAIRYFSTVPGFDLYGYKWDGFIRHPLYIHYGSYVKKTWRGTTPDKIKTLSEYTFCLCYENCAYPGYFSEKIFDCLAAGCIPVYLGAPDITDVVPASCFIDFRNFPDYPSLHRHLSSLSEHDISRYRAAIAAFLHSRSGSAHMHDFVQKLIA